jgi:micrococcal nuclease
MFPGDEVLYWYKAVFARTVDGDTVDVVLDLGYRFKRDTMRYRLFGINAPEKKSPTYEAGVAAEEFLKKLLAGAGDRLRVKSYRDDSDKYGDRWLGELYTRVSYNTPGDARTAYADPTGEWTNLNQLMVQAGHAVPYTP